MQVSSFYRKGIGSWQARLASAEEQFQQKPVPLKYHQRIAGPAGDWLVFHCQRNALQYSNKNKSELRVFSFESDSFTEQHGQRYFLVASSDQFWHYYKQLTSAQRHHYEVIAEDLPCHLYFDVEFPTACNPSVNGNEVAHTFILYLCLCVNIYYGLNIDPKVVLVLDSSTEVKFSQHFIFHIPGAVFRDNRHTGTFVKLCIGKLTEFCQVDYGGLGGLVTPARDLPLTVDLLHAAGLTIPQLRSIFVLDSNSRLVPLCDLSVYSRNRNFRLYMSSKLGKNNPLLVSGSSVFVSNNTSVADRYKQIFLDSLIAHVGSAQNLQLLECIDTRQQTWTAHESSVTGSEGRTVDGEVRRGSGYAVLDQFVLTLVRDGAVSGSIRCCQPYKNSQVLVFDIAGFRWCEVIGRAHRSNNIMIIVDLMREVYYQKCHDPDCRATGYKPTEHPVPSEVMQQIRSCNYNTCWDKQEDLVSDDDLVLAGDGEDWDDGWTEADYSCVQDVEYEMPAEQHFVNSAADIPPNKSSPRQLSIGDGCCDDMWDTQFESSLISFCSSLDCSSDGALGSNCVQLDECDDPFAEELVVNTQVMNDVNDSCSFSGNDDFITDDELVSFCL